MADPDTGWRRTVILPGVVLALAVMGDALIYVVLPLHAAAFGIGLGWVGVMLAANRVVRILLYRRVAQAIQRHGVRRPTILAVIAAAATTLAYGLLDGPVALLAGRIVWGLAFATLNLTVLAYAIASRQDAGARVGVNRAINQAGPALALSIGVVGAAFLGPRDIFLVLAVITLAALPLSLGLPELPAPAEDRDGARRLSPTSIDMLFFVIGFVTDGLLVLTLPLLLAGRLSMESALLASGLVLALRYVVGVVASPVGGLLADRFGAGRLVAASCLAMALGFVALAWTESIAAAAVIVTARALLAILGPLLVAQRSGSVGVHRLSVFSTWLDLGAAAGPLAAAWLYQRVDLPALYFAAAALLVAALAAEAGGRRI